jgi:hypothetical protein
MLAEETEAPQRQSAPHPLPLSTATRQVSSHCTSPPSSRNAPPKQQEKYTQTCYHHSQPTHPSNTPPTHSRKLTGPTPQNKPTPSHFPIRPAPLYPSTTAHQPQSLHNTSPTFPQNSSHHPQLSLHTTKLPPKQPSTPAPKQTANPDPAFFPLKCPTTTTALQHTTSKENNT